ncbi:Penicillin-binding protein 1F [Planctomycetes bacterium Poly30]|uniref:peptidoglycan glycosyltransferase n=1 Tax=Saltatorellus ferox TaxID=2528018 RepID=A0A518EQ66_9BACT|nr:Penicillin-binding protein 1F [Planctomycetes bacterium Poly30]
MKESIVRAEPSGGSTRRGRLRRWLVRAAAGGGLAIAAAWLAAPLGYRLLDARYPLSLASLELPPSGHVSAAEGGPEFARRVAKDEQWRRPVPLSEMGRWLPLATIAIEDVRFREHGGVDARAVARAAVRNVRSLRVREGASTLTMQLVGMTHRTPRTLRGKAIEAFRALQVEDRLSKDEILERYLNAVPYGANVVGAAMGAEAWFGCSAADLSLGEAALLAGLPQAPSRLQPDRHPERARARREAVLSAMRRAGLITEDEAIAAREVPVPQRLWPGRSGAPPLPATLHAAAWSLGERPSGGTTALRPELQTLADRLVRAHCERLAPGTEIALLAIDVAGARVVAHIGSAAQNDPLDGQVDGARAWRSPGSTLKPFVYAAAMEAGLIDADTLLDDTALDLDGWRPTNFDGAFGSFGGRVTVADALRRSLNLPALRAGQIAGLDRCLGLIEAAGVVLPESARRESGLALVTGGTRVRLVDLVNAYATLARGGLYRPTGLWADGSDGTLEAVRAISETTCEVLNDILSDEHRAPRIHGGGSHVGGVGFMWKTGTSSGHRDAWAVGHNGEFSVGVWVGRFSGAGDPAYVGAEVAEPILAEFMAALKSLK